MRRIAGGVLLLLALLGVVGGAAMAILLGPDDRAVTGPHPIDEQGAPVVTAPGVISWVGPTVTVQAEVPGDDPVFVGVANSVDVEDYLDDTAHVTVDSYRVPWRVTTSHVDGRPSLPASPTALDWWIADSAGVGGASTTFTLPDQTVSVAVLPVGAHDLKGLDVTLAYEVRGGFGIGLGAVAVALGLGLLGWVMVRRRPLLHGGVTAGDVAVPGAAAEAGDWDDEWDNESDPAEPDEGSEPAEGVHEEVVYVWVDDDGVEHEISAEEAQNYEVVEVTEVDPDPRATGRGRS